MHVMERIDERTNVYPILGNREKEKKKRAEDEKRSYQCLLPLYHISQKILHGNELKEEVTKEGNAKEVGWGVVEIMVAAVCVSV